MHEGNHESLRRLFERAIDLPAGERPMLLDRECSPGVRPRLDAMLAAAESDDPFLADPPAGAAPTLGDERPGSVIGPYKLLEQIGEGGFGVVFLAEQREPVHRRVALKIIKLGMDTRAVIARFEAERQALAMMDHPHIARVLEAGATETGRPYFVMELVKGEPITKFCDVLSLGIPDRLALFTQVCHAVQHAHAKGVIHRDLKPSNILVSTQDGRPLAKVIDFGIAKATMGGPLTARTLFTEHRALIGTPEYMSPEQAAGSLDIDTRSDVYALGVLLYELLTGATPFDAKQLRSAAYAEIQRIIREEEPPKPSTRVSTLAALGTAAAQRRAEPRRLGALLRGDLDWIVMRSLEKDRARRYETANGLALDVERYLKSEPVLAGPPSRVYRLRKFARRNRAVVIAAALVAGTLVAGIAGTTFGLVRAERRRAEAETAREQTQKVSDFQAAMLSGIDADAMGRAIKQHFRDQVRAALERPDVGDSPDGRTRTSEEIEAELAAFDQRADAAEESDVARLVLEEVLLAPAAETLERQFADQPLVRARLHHAIAESYHDLLGLNDAAELHARKALEIGQAELGDGHELVAASLRLLGHLRFHDNNYSAARPLFTEALTIYQRIYGDGSSQVAGVLDELSAVLYGEDAGAEAERLYRQALATARRQFGTGHPDVAPHVSNLARLLSRRGDDAEAEALYAEALAIERKAHRPVRASGATCMSNLAELLLNRGDYAGAEALYTEALAIQRRAYGDEHRQVAITLNNLRYLRWKRGDHAGVERVFHINPANGHRYCTTSFRCWGASDATPGRARPDWWDAEAEARALGGHLATIDDAGEDAWLFSTFGPGSFWIGLTDWDSEGAFHWISGAPVAYTDWDTIAGVVFQPDNAHAGGEDSVHVNGDRSGRWNDLGERGNSPGHSSHSHYGIIELDPPTRADPDS